MKSLERLRQGLAAAAALLDDNWQEATLIAMRRDASRMSEWVKAGADDSNPPKDRIAEAIWAFRKRQAFGNFSTARYTCFGCADPIGREQYRLIEDEGCFPRLLECVDAYGPTPRRFRRCYRGLLHGYIAYDPKHDEAKPTGRRNWERLQAYLSQRNGQIRIPNSTEPEWVGSIIRNRDLLTERACQELGRTALDGDRSHFETIRNELEISDQSWVVRNFILAQLDAAANRADHLYKQLLSQLQGLLEKHPLFLDEGLARLLERYRVCKPPDLDVGLRDFAVGHWGNPWLKLNDKRWGRVSAETRQMVTGWLKLKLMRDFFRLLSDDGINDRRRLEFWLRYIDQIGDMYFALGKEAMQNSDPDFRQLREEMKGRLLHLYASQGASNNAFLMKIGNYMMVEFGDKGNAFFAFDCGKGLPFKLEGWVAGNATELKHPSHELRLRHADTNEGTWEQQFERHLQRLLGISSGQAHIRSSVRTQSPHAKPTYPDATFSQAGFDELVRRHGLRIGDKRRVGGALWVHVGKADTLVTMQLKRWGFKYNEHKTAWWRS